MANNIKKRRLYALGESIILVEGEKIISCYNIEPEELKDEIDRVMSKPFKRPSDIFKEVIENIIGGEEIFGNGKLRVGNVEHILCEQKIYKFCEQIILTDVRFVKKQEMYTKRKQENKEYLNRVKAVASYYQCKYDRTMEKKYRY